jgi:hypothetical protein
LLTLTAATIHGGDAGSTQTITATGDSLPAGARELNHWATKERLFYPHVRFALLGEEAAGDTETFFRWVVEGLRGRPELPLYIIRYSSARELIAAGDITPGLEALSGREEPPFTLLEIQRQLAATGAALCSVVEAEPPGAHLPNAEAGTLLPRSAGYGVLRTGQPPVFLTAEESLGASLLTRRRESYTLPLAGGEAEIKPVALQIRHRGTTGEIVLDYTARPPAGTGQSLDAGAVDAALSAVIAAALERSAALEADFLQLGAPTDTKWNLRLRGTLLPGAGREAP